MINTHLVLVSLSVYTFDVSKTTFEDKDTGLVSLPELPVLPPTVAGEVKGCEDTSRSGRRAHRPPAPPAFP
jgi:hypothetical protein